jgi:hypothetical protein
MAWGFRVEPPRSDDEMEIEVNRILATVRTIVVGLIVATLVGAPSAPATSRARGLELTGAAASQSELIERLLTTLSAKDLDALHALRATESEWKAMFEWQVPVGARPRVTRADVQELAWRMLDTKSLYYERYLIERYGGRRWDVKAVSFSKGTDEWAGYRAHRQLRLDLVDDGNEAELATGSIVEVDGRFKFASFVRD